MKKLIAFVAILGMVFISYNTQATCNTSSGYAECYTSGVVTSDGTSYYAPASSYINFFWHLVNGSTSNGTFVIVETDTGNQSQYMSMPYDNSYSGTGLFSNSGYLNMLVTSNNGGYAFVSATW